MRPYLRSLAFAAGALPLALVLPAPAADAPETITVGRLTLEACALPDGNAYCGSLTRPLDPSGKVAGDIEIGFEWWPRTAGDGPSAGVLAAFEGGPGYPSTGSASYYLPLFGPLRESRDVLFVDQRGTGKSGALVCQDLQDAPGYPADLVRACGAALGETAGYYGTGLAADDFAAVLDALGIAKVDLYSDSYGTQLAQAFAVRHGGRINHLVLDSAYPARGGTAWYEEALPAGMANVDTVCERSASCAALGGKSSDRLLALLAELRAHPGTVTGMDGNGESVDVEMAAPALLLALMHNSSGPTLLRELDAAARAYLGGDKLPFARLVAEGNYIQDGGLLYPDAEAFSEAAYLAVNCVDMPQAYDMSAGEQVRKPRYDAALAEEEKADPDVYAPFTIEEFNKSLWLENSTARCLTWPALPADRLADKPATAGSVFPDLPVLVLSGELDSLTTPAEGRATAALFPNATFVSIANSFHITAAGDYNGCAGVIARNFLDAGDPGDTSCAGKVAAIRMVPAFAKSVSDVKPARSAPGSAAEARDLAVAAAAVWTTGDIVARWWANWNGDGKGLHGGTFAYDTDPDDGDVVVFTLDGVKWTDDLAVSGTVRWNQYSGAVSGDLDVSGEGTDGKLAVAWGEKNMEPATVKGEIGGKPVDALVDP